MSAVRYIACGNSAAFVMNFSIKWQMEENGNWQETSWNSGNYSFGDERVTPDLASIGVPVDAYAIAPWVHAELGKSEGASDWVTYAANGQRAMYQVTGTTLDFHINLEGA